MSEWKKVKLRDLATKITKGTTPSNIGESFCNRGVPFIRSELITQNKYISDEGILYISNQTHEKLKRSQLEVNDILFSMAGVYLGKTAILRECDVPANTNQAVAIIRLDSALCSVDFVYYYLNKESIIRYVNQISGQAAQPNINLQQIGEIPIVLPSRKEQQSISTILSRYDSLIENYQKQIKLLEEAAQRLYKEWFVDLHFPGHENTKIVDGVPEGWEKKTIDDFALIKSGYAFKSKDWQSIGCPVVKIKDINGTFVLSDSLDCVPVDVAKKANHYILRAGDLVIAMTGATIGKVGIVTEDNIYTNQRVGKFFVKNRFLLPFLFCYFKQKTTIDLVLKVSSSSAAQPNISGSQLGSFDFIYNKEFLESFCDKEKYLFQKIILLQKQIRLLTEARDRLLPKLMSGEIVV